MLLLVVVVFAVVVLVVVVVVVVVVVAATAAAAVVAAVVAVLVAVAAVAAGSIGVGRRRCRGRAFRGWAGAEIGRARRRSARRVAIVTGALRESVQGMGRYGVVARAVARIRSSREV